MKVAVFSLVLVMISMTAYADDIFSDRELRTIRVIEASKGQAAAWITDLDGNEAQVYIGDTIGIEGATVIAIDSASITVQIDNRRLKMLAIRNLVN
jgi:hypothetical protein